MPVALPRPGEIPAPRPRAVLIDVGFTLTSYDGARVAALAAAAGVCVSPAAVEGTERALRAELATHAWPQRPGSEAKAAGGARFFARMLALAGAAADEERLARAAAHLWEQHLVSNLWSRVLDGVAASLASLRAAGLRLAVVSNSEGTLEAMLSDPAVDLTRHFDVVLDSWVVGLTKPDPRIFHLALDRLGIAAAEAIMVGDSPAADCEGALAAGARAALLDPFDLHPAARVPRFPDFPAFARAVLAAGASAE